MDFRLTRKAVLTHPDHTGSACTSVSTSSCSDCFLMRRNTGKPDIYSCNRNRLNNKDQEYICGVKMLVAILTKIYFQLADAGLISPR